MRAETNNGRRASHRPAGARRAAHEQALGEILAAPVGDRRLRTNPRRIKRKMPGWHVKRPEHRNWPQPTLTPAARIKIAA